MAQGAVLMFMDKALMARRVQVVVAPAVEALEVKTVARVQVIITVAHTVVALAQIKAPVQVLCVSLAPVLPVCSHLLA